MLGVNSNQKSKIRSIVKGVCIENILDEIIEKNAKTMYYKVFRMTSTSSILFLTGCPQADYAIIKSDQITATYVFIQISSKSSTKGV